MAPTPLPIHLPEAPSFAAGRMETTLLRILQRWNCCIMQTPICGALPSPTHVHPDWIPFARPHYICPPMHVRYINPD